MALVRCERRQMHKTDGATFLPNRMGGTDSKVSNVKGKAWGWYNAGKEKHWRRSEGEEDRADEDTRSDVKPAQNCVAHQWPAKPPKPTKD